MTNFVFFVALYKKKEAHAPGPGRGWALAWPGLAAARPKNMSINVLLYFKSQQKNKSGQKSASLFVKRSKKKSGQKSASLLVKRSKSAKMSKNGRAVLAVPCQIIPCRAVLKICVPAVP